MYRTRQAGAAGTLSLARLYVIHTIQRWRKSSCLGRGEEGRREDMGGNHHFIPLIAIAGRRKAFARAVKLLHRPRFARGRFAEAVEAAAASNRGKMRLPRRKLRPRGLGPFGGPRPLGRRFPHGNLTFSALYKVHIFNNIAEKPLKSSCCNRRN